MVVFPFQRWVTPGGRDADLLHLASQGEGPRTCRASRRRKSRVAERDPARELVQLAGQETATSDRAARFGARPWLRLDSNNRWGAHERVSVREDGRPGDLPRRGASFLALAARRALESLDRQLSDSA
jgi:hypothetical protein